MRKFAWLALVPLVVMAGNGGYSQDKTDAIELKVVRYDGLADAVARNRGKVVLVDFWADYCVPCKRSFPHLVQMHKQHAKDGLAVITVSLDDIRDKDAKPEEVKENVHKFLKSQGATFTNLLLDEESKYWQEKLRFSGPPCYYVFNRQGKWTQFHTDKVEKLDHDAIDRLVEEYLKEK